MPLIKTAVSVECTPEQKVECAKALSKICAEQIGKPEVYVSSIFEDGVTIAFGGEIQPSAFVVVKSIGGLNKEVNVGLSKAICEYLSTTLNIPGEAVYLNFIDVPATQWGCNGQTFG